MSKLKAQVKYILDQKVAGHLTSEIYFISDREIKPGDLCFNSYDNRIWTYQPIPYPLPYWGNLNTLKKLEASTVKTLNVPLIPSSFVEKAREIFKISPIDIVELELLEATRHESLENYDDDVIYFDGEIIKTLDKDESFDLSQYTKLKIRDNGTVVVSKAKTSFTLEEVQQIASAAHTLGREDVLASQKSGKYIDTFNEWFIEQV